jgi:hypothetical protein
MATLQYLIAAFAESSQRQIVGLLTLTVAGVGSRRYCTGVAPITSNSLLYSPLWFDLRLPSVEGGAIRAGELVLDNTGEEPLASILQLDNTTREIKAVLEIVLESSPDSVEHRSEWHVIPSVNYGVGEVRCRLGYATVLDDSYPQVTFTPGQFAGVF